MFGEGGVWYGFFVLFFFLGLGGGVFWAVRVEGGGGG